MANSAGAKAVVIGIAGLGVVTALAVLWVVVFGVVPMLP